MQLACSDNAAVAVKTFQHPQTAVGDLDSGSAAALIAAASDVTLIVDANGTIKDTAFQSMELLGDLADSTSWFGRKVTDLVAPDSRGKVVRILAEAGTSAEPRWRHINHVGAGGQSVPVLYCGVQVGAGGRVVMFGRDLRALSQLQQRLVNAQRSMEHDYTRLRDVEMRYRLLFQLSGEAVLILDPQKRRVTEANPAAQAIFGASPVGQGLAELFAPDCMSGVDAELDTVRSGGPSVEQDVRLQHGSRTAKAKLSLFRQDEATMVLMRVTVQEPAGTGLPDIKSKLLRAVESAPDGFVVTDDDGLVLTANAAFLEMAELRHEEQARGQSLDRWVGQTGMELDVLTHNLRTRGSVRFFATVLRGEEGGSTTVEISAVSVRNGGQPSFGYAIRNVSARMIAPVVPAAARQLPRSVEQLTELIGRVSLKELVREATEVIERLSIEAALELTKDNRASAAELLGLSRQSLYVKLRRYGLGDLATVERD